MTFNRDRKRRQRRRYCGETDDTQLCLLIGGLALLVIFCGAAYLDHLARF